MIALAFSTQWFSTCAGASTCDEAFTDWYNANANYEIARYSYFYGIPTSCYDECNQPGAPQGCYSDCMISRRTQLAESELNLLQKAIRTCIPTNPDECSRARGWAEQCLIDYNFLSYPDPEESLAVYTQYSACRLASKVDSCQ